MCTVIIDGKTYRCDKGTLLSELLTDSEIQVFHPCGGNGICKKCKVRVNGETVLSCRYRISSDITVETYAQSDIASEDGLEAADCESDNTCLVLDMGTTTLSLALIDKKSGKALQVLTQPNSQGLYAADVISRTKISKDYGPLILHTLIISQIKRMMKLMGIASADELFVAGNTIMLHTFFGEDCALLGVAPYTPVFLEGRSCNGSDIQLDNIKRVYSLPAISAFAGADITAGLNAVGFPEKGKYRILADLGTNAEIVLFSQDKMLVTSAAAGPCFEGVGIECGMSASKGAIYEYRNAADFRTVENAEAEGICSTGIIDAVAVMLRNEIIDATGYMETQRFTITDKVYITREDIRHFQTAKSAVYSGIMTLIKKAGITPDQTEKLFISGGFATKMNIDNAVTAGIIPKSLKDRCVPLKNTCLAGTVKYACERNDIDALIKNAEYIDLSGDSDFSESFIENMLFDTDE